ncbi:3,4-dihydroxy-2-butanone-4-phosphate synthase [Bacteroides sp. BFG-638]|uniref:3,4-dihydroxy-2-butanone-4-phosphate synthase n=1 Tax=Bacteroides TaxID=816 RepID=UPI002165DFC1|nr:MULTISPECIES: 3,4-dihydroxy-2-butanone-4-phosphate synthase [unclassified Bacteroides]MCS2947201.1 3,4-dihydroxy-2-butanone-4-phosphate synthase [Bacteroides sp. BFG-638]MCS3310833.1 3,4-dihydroxy-2-butanone-4-phosphate synthase [Bacteroides sp. BFG-637]
MLNTVEEGLEMIRQGKIIIIVDDEDRENEGDFVVAGEKITPEIVNFMITNGRGLLCAPLPRTRCEELELYPIASQNTSLLGTPFTMSVDLRGHGCTTGVSAFDRSATIRALVSEDIAPTDLARPGHIFPLYGVKNGVLERNGHTEALLDMTRLAGLKAGGALIEILNKDGSMARLPELYALAQKYQLKIISIKSIQEYRIKNNL